VCFGLWFAAHSFFAALFVGCIVVMWVRKSIHNAMRAEPDTSDAKVPPTPAASHPKAEGSPPAPVTPIKRQYAKSAVVVPLKTGTDD
jgi:hypothetical protein